MAMIGRYDRRAGILESVMTGHHRRCFVALCAIISLLASVPAQAQKPTQKPATAATTADMPAVKPLVQSGHNNALIDHYSERAGQRLTMFGGSVYQAPHHGPAANDTHMAPLGQVDDRYRLGPGDELVIRLRGSTNRTNRAVIDASGQVVLDDILPVMAAGETLGDFKRQLEAEVSRRFLDTQVFVGVDRLRQITISITGAVTTPGTLQLSGLATPLDALRAAGGVTPLGSLRRIVWHQGNRPDERVMLDLYDYLLGDDPALAQATLRNGDQLYVPPLGPTMAIAGAVKRAGIFEIGASDQSDQALLTTDQMMRLAGGPLYPGAHQLVLNRLDADGLERQRVLDPSGNTTLRDGDLVIWQIPSAIPQGGIRLVGHTGALTSMPLEQAASLARLLQHPGVVRPDSYGWLGLIERRPLPTGQTSYLPFAPAAIINGEQDRRLQDRDRVILFPADLFPIADDGMNEAASKPVLDETAGADAGSTLTRWFAAQGLDDPRLAPLITSLSVDIGGAVQQPGRYPVAAPLSAQAALLLAGDTQPGATLINVQLTRQDGDQYRRDDLSASELASATLQAGDALFLTAETPVTSRLVTIHGAVHRPGRYPVAAGERLSSLIARAGGLTSQAFADGAIFTRASERRKEANRNQQAARELDQAMARVLSREDKVDSNLVIMSERLAHELRAAETLGRITVEADPHILNQRPDLDVLLQAGDQIYYPEQTLTVRVSGEVQSPSALQFESGKTASDYLRDAGGFTALADKSRSFVVNPDGSARPLRVSSWNYDPVVILPGSTIVAPRDPKPFDAIELTANIGNILSQIAVSAASIAVIADNDD